MIPHLAWSVISTVKTNFIIWETRDWSWKPANFSTKPLAETQWKRAATFNQWKRCGNTKECLHFHLTRFPSKLSHGNATEFWTIRFPQHFRIAETSYFTLWNVTWLKCHASFGSESKFCCCRYFFVKISRLHEVRTSALRWTEFHQNRKEPMRARNSAVCKLRS